MTTEHFIAVSAILQDHTKLTGYIPTSQEASKLWWLENGKRNVISSEIYVKHTFFSIISWDTSTKTGHSIYMLQNYQQDGCFLEQHQCLWGWWRNYNNKNTHYSLISWMPLGYMQDTDVNLILMPGTRASKMITLKVLIYLRLSVTYSTLYN